MTLRENKIFQWKIFLKKSRLKTKIFQWEIFLKKRPPEKHVFQREIFWTAEKHFGLLFSFFVPCFLKSAGHQRDLTVQMVLAS